MLLKLVCGLPLVLGSFFCLQPAWLMAEDHLVLKVWPGEVPGEQGGIGPEAATPSKPGQKQVVRISNVTEPTLTLYRASKEKANGCGVVICPGGGYNILAWDLEGTEVAEWFNSIGVTAVVLKYRVPRRKIPDFHTPPLQDAQRAMRLTRQHAKDWGIDSNRLGMLGFSAGGHLTVLAGTQWDTNTYKAVDNADELSCRPDFMIPIYPAYLGDKSHPNQLNPLVRVTKDTPRTFLAITQDDSDRAIYAALLFVALKRAKVESELHIYSKGGHGYGLRESELPISKWSKRCEEWMQVRGLLKK